jgi:hypothetical protein
MAVKAAVRGPKTINYAYREKTPLVRRAPTARSAVTNGKRLFTVGDGNSPWARRWRDLVAGHISDLGGPSQLSEAQISLVKRASAVECELEAMEGKLSLGEPINLDVFTRSASHLRRILESLGLKRQARDASLIEHDADAAFRQQVLEALREDDAGEEARP